jgi:NADPH:quinone reductase
MVTMQAVMLTKEAGPEAFQKVELPLWEPAPGEVRLIIRATGVGATDAMMRRKSYAFAPPTRFFPGCESIGNIDAVGNSVISLQEGDRV